MTPEPDYTPKPATGAVTRDELLAMVEGDQRDSVADMLNRGLSVAVYENHDLGHSMLGQKVFLSYGGPASTFDVPPPHAPDMATIGLGWRYILVGTCST